MLFMGVHTKHRRTASDLNPAALGVRRGMALGSPMLHGHRSSSTGQVYNKHLSAKGGLEGVKNLVPESLFSKPCFPSLVTDAWVTCHKDKQRGSLSCTGHWMHNPRPWRNGRHTDQEQWAKVT
jgi:hypothetical protein